MTTTSIDRNIKKKVVNSLKEQTTTCGECVGYSTEIVRDKKLCRDRDIIASSKPCTQFVPDTNSLMELIEDGETFQAISKIVGAVEDSKLRALGALIMREGKTRNAGYKMGQKIYVRYRGTANSNYVSNFMTAYIMFADIDTVRIGSQDGKITMTFAHAARAAILTRDDFLVIRKKMIAKNRLVDPDTHRAVSKRLRAVEEYELGIDASRMGEVPTIDSVFKSNGTKKSKTAGPNDLISIVRSIENGFMASDKKSAPKRGKKVKNSKKSISKGITEINVS